MSLKNCVDSALAQGQITKEEADALKKRYDALARRILDPNKVKGQIMEELQAEAAEKQRRALLTETARKRLTETLDSYRTEDGEADPVQAFLMLHHHTRDSFGGRKIMDADTLKDVIVGKSHADLAEFLHAFRRGAITGDLRRRRKPVRMRLDNVGREIMGEKTADAEAAAFAGALTKVAEDLRVRFNEAGGAIGKLKYGWLPQSWDQHALANFVDKHGMDALLDRVIPELDREKMLNQLTGKAMTDDELREGARIALERAMTDGWIDREVTGVPVTRGALWSQHAHHRFFHFKDFDAWKRVAQDFGNADIYQAYMAHIAVMARDIAHMETFGPNPNVMRTYLRNLVQQKAATMLPVRSLIKTETRRLAQLAERLTKPNPDYQAIIDRIGAIHGELAAIRRKHAPQLGGRPSERNARKMEALQNELLDLEQKLAPFHKGEKSMTVEDAATTAEMRNVLDRMRDPVTFADVDNPRAYADKMIRKADSMWEHMRGSLNAPAEAQVANAFSAFRDEPSMKRLGRIGWAIVEAPFTAQGQASLRNWLTASMLGGAALSAISDPVFGTVRRGFVGMAMNRANTIHVLKETIRHFSQANQMQAVRNWQILDSALHVFHQQARYTGTVDTRALTGFLADRVISLQGLAAITQAGKHAFSLDFQGWMADHVQMKWADLPAALRDTLDYHGFDAASWDKIRSAGLHEWGGATLLRPNEIDAVDPRLAERYLAMILRERNHAVPEGNVRSRSIIMGSTRPGTLSGELVRNFAQFKSFGASVILLHMAQVVRDAMRGNWGRAAPYAATLLITGTLMGTVAMALKDIKDGRDPRRWLDDDTYLDPWVWGAALLQAGGLGIYGDFLFAQLNRHGGSLPATVAGPLVGWVDNLRNLTVGNVAQMIQGKETRFGPEFVRFLRRNSPLLSMWYTSLVWNRVVLDQMQKMVDPDAHAAFRRQIQNRRRDYNGQSYWWAPGTDAPQRAPNLGAVVQ